MRAERLRGALAGIGLDPDPRELADLLWLAVHLEASPPAARAPATEPPALPSPVPRSVGTPPPAPPPPALSAPPPVPAPLPVPLPVPLHLPGPDSVADGTAAATLLAPGAAALGHRLEIQRSLRPLRRRVADPRRQSIDEAATADRIAHLGLDRRPWMPVVRPGRRRWLDLAVVVDTGPSMALWRQLAAELRQTLTESGAFRTVSTWDLHPSGDGGVVIAPGAGGPGRSPAALIRPDGQQVVLVVSDCCGPVWQDGAIDPMLRRLGRHGPLAVVQPLPERLWDRTAAPVTVGRLTPPGPCAPNTDLRFTAFDALPGPAADALLLPVVEPDPSWLAGWAALVADGTPLEPAAVAYRPNPPTDLTAEAGGEPLDRVRAFRAAASPAAVRLMRCLATTTPALPIMRLIQREVLGRPAPGDLAEVVLSGLLTAGQGGRYAFLPGVREALLDGLGRADATSTVDVLTRLSRSIERDAGLSTRMFRALTPADGDGPGLPAGSGPFALISPVAMRRLYPAARRFTTTTSATAPPPAATPPTSPSPIAAAPPEPADLTSDPGYLESLLHDIADSRSAEIIRQAAIQALDLIGSPDQICDVLVERLPTEYDSSVRAELIRILAWAPVDDPRIVDTFVQYATRDPDPDTRTAAAEALATQPVAGPYRALFANTLSLDTSAQVRLVAVRAIARDSDPGTTTTLGTILASDADFEVVEAAVEALLARDPRAVSAVAISRLSDPDPRIRVLMIDSLGGFLQTDDRARRAVLDRARNATEPGERRAAVLALGTIAHLSHTRAALRDLARDPAVTVATAAQAILNRRNGVRAVLLGDTTLAEALAANLAVPRISAGRLVREHLENGTRLGEAARNTVAHGRPVPDNIMLAVIRLRLSDPDADSGFVLDGYPRTASQSADLDELLSRRGTEVDVALEIGDGPPEVSAFYRERQRLVAASGPVEEVVDAIDRFLHADVIEVLSADPVDPWGVSSVEELLRARIPEECVRIELAGPGALVSTAHAEADVDEVSHAAYDLTIVEVEPSLDSAAWQVDDQLPNGALVGVAEFNATITFRGRATLDEAEEEDLDIEEHLDVDLVQVLLVWDVTFAAEGEYSFDSRTLTLGPFRLRAVG
jgi:adenylate kinase family enzyme/HEAT repeat protein